MSTLRSYVYVQGTDAYDVRTACDRASPDETARPYHPCLDGAFELSPSRDGIVFAKRKNNDDDDDYDESSSATDPYMCTVRWVFSKTHRIHDRVEDDSESNSRDIDSYIITPPFSAIYRKTENEDVARPSSNTMTCFLKNNSNARDDASPIIRKVDHSPLFDDVDGLSYLDIDVLFKTDAYERETYDEDDKTFYERGIDLLARQHRRTRIDDRNEKQTCDDDTDYEKLCRMSTQQYVREEYAECGKSYNVSSDDVLRSIITFRTNPLATRPFDAFCIAFKSTADALTSKRKDIYDAFKKRKDEDVDGEYEENVPFDTTFARWCNPNTDKLSCHYDFDRRQPSTTEDNVEFVSIKIIKQQTWSPSVEEPPSSSYYCSFEKDVDVEGANIKICSIHDISRIFVLFLHHSLKLNEENNDDELCAEFSNWSKTTLLKSRAYDRKHCKTSSGSEDVEKEEEWNVDDRLISEIMSDNFIIREPSDGDDAETVYDDIGSFTHRRHRVKGYATDDDEIDDASESRFLNATLQRIESFSSIIGLYCRFISHFENVLKTCVDEDVDRSLFYETQLKAKKNLNDIVDWIRVVHASLNGNAGVQVEIKEDYNVEGLFESLVDSHICAIWSNLLKEAQRRQHRLRRQPRKDVHFLNDSDVVSDDVERNTIDDDDDKDVVIVDVICLFNVILESIVVVTTVFKTYKRLVKECRIDSKTVVKDIEKTVFEDDFRTYKTTASHKKQSDIFESPKRRDAARANDGVEQQQFYYLEKNTAFVPKWLIVTDVLEYCKKNDIVDRFREVTQFIRESLKRTVHSYDAYESLWDNMYRLGIFTLSSDELGTPNGRLCDRIIENRAKVVQIDAIESISSIALRASFIETYRTPHKNHILFSLAYLMWLVEEEEEEEEDALKNATESKEKCNASRCTIKKAPAFHVVVDRNSWSMAWWYEEKNDTRHPTKIASFVTFSKKKTATIAISSESSSDSLKDDDDDDDDDNDEYESDADTVKPTKKKTRPTTTRETVLYRVGTSTDFETEEPTFVDDENTDTVVFETEQYRDVLYDDDDDDDDEIATNATDDYSAFTMRETIRDLRKWLIAKDTFLFFDGSTIPPKQQQQQQQQQTGDPSSLL